MPLFYPLNKASRGDKLRLINTTLAIGSRAHSARTEVSHVVFRAIMFSHYDYLDLECNTWSFGCFWKPGQDGPIDESSHQDVKYTPCPYNFITLYLFAQNLVKTWVCHSESELSFGDS